MDADYVFLWLYRARFTILDYEYTYSIRYWVAGLYLYEGRIANSCSDYVYYWYFDAHQTILCTIPRITRSSGDLYHSFFLNGA
jgi:hypothetical protein